MNNSTIQLKKTQSPCQFLDVPPVPLTDETMQERKHKILTRMHEEGFDAIIIYSDLEHGGNFEYLTGFVPRFEEALLVLSKSGQATMILGNENLKMAAHSRLPVSLKHCCYFSLPNQPMEQEKSLEMLFAEIDLGSYSKIGLVGWKMFTSQSANNKTLFDIPYFIVDAVKKSIAPQATLENAAYLFISGTKGARTTNNDNEIAHYEYAANLASNCMLNAMNAVEPGIREIDLGSLLSAEGQRHSVVTIAAAGQRFEKANFFPTYKKVEQGQPLCLTTGFKGGLSSRTGFVIADESELPEGQQDYLNRVAKPYFSAVVAWLEHIKIGMQGGEMYELIENVLPKEKYGWHLNPGHLTAEEEWMSSPIYKGSRETLQSGMILQIDIIPSVSGYTGVSAEEGVVLADKLLQDKIKLAYPELWQRIITRRHYIQTELNIKIAEDVLPLSNTVAYLRPFLLAKALSFSC